MLRPSILLSCLLLALPAFAADVAYPHSHDGAPAQLQNRDTRFGSPAHYQRGNLYRRNLEVRISGAGIETPQTLALPQRSVANFDIRNGGEQDLLLVLGDDACISAVATLVASKGAAAALDFHVWQIKASEVAQFAWRFDTYATRQVNLAVIDGSGRISSKTLAIKVGPLQQRNAHLAGQ